MSDLRGFLSGGVDDFHPPSEQAFDTTIQRVRRRGRRRVVVAGAATFGVIAAMVGGLWWIFEPSPSPRPIAGPSPSPTPVQRPIPKTACYRGFDGGLPRCVSRNGPIVRIATGTGHGTSSWTLLGFRASYNGPAPERRWTGPPVTRPMLCISWTAGGQTPEFMCQTVYRDDGLGVFGMQFGAGLRPRVPEPEWSGRVAHGDPLKLLEDGGPDGGTNTETHHVTWGWTSPATSWVSVMPQGQQGQPVTLFGPFAELGTNVRWFVAFSPVDVPAVTVTAHSPSGKPIWEEREQQVVPVRVVKAGTGTGTVVAFAPLPSECVGCRAPRPRIDCGTECTTGVLPGFDLVLEAEATPGSRFVRWEDGCTSTQPSCALTVRRGMDVTAVFEPAA
jgi:hypothetical protein